MRILLSFDLPSSRAALLGLRPELRAVLRLADTLAFLHNQQRIDATSYDLACSLARVVRHYVGAVAETDRAHLDIGQRLALMRLKQAVRDLQHAVCWPLGRGAGASRLVLSQRGVLALGRLGLYDPIRGVSSYNGDMAADMRDLADAVTVAGPKT